MVTKFLRILFILIASSSVFSAVQSSLQKTVTTYERKILFEEKQWQLRERHVNTSTSHDIWKLDNETIEVAITEYVSKENAIENQRTLKGSAASGKDRDVIGLGDSAFEHIGYGGTVTAILFVKNNLFVHIESTLKNRAGSETLYRFAIHVLDSIENESGISHIGFWPAALNYERKILEKENGWRLSTKTLQINNSETKWESEDGSISITIYKFESSQKALEFLEGTKTSRSSGRSQNIQGFGDAAYEHFGNGDLLHDIVFVKGNKFITVRAIAKDRAKLVDPMRRFSKHVLDAIEGK